MTPELWEKLNPLFMNVIGKPRAERRAAIENLCAQNLELERELLALVEAHERDETATLNVSKMAINAIESVERMSLRAGDRLLGRFTIVRHLGSGGMGDVYEAFDAELSHSIALKVIRSDIARIDGILARFKKEVQLARRLSGPNICRIHEFFVVGGQESSPGSAFFTMELLEGVTLDQLSSQGPLPKAQAAQIALDLCSALTTIHAAGIIHRDLKTRNVMMVDRAGRKTAVLMDFGLAREFAAPAATAATQGAGLTLPGTPVGTPEYMAPEQFEGGAVTAATDVYSLGVVLYELATGRHPYVSSNPLGAAVRRARPPVPVSSINRSLPHQWDRTIVRCLEFDAEKRFQSAAEVARALRSSPFPIAALARVPAKTLIWPTALLMLALSLLALLLLVISVRPLNESFRGMLSPSQKHIAVLPFDLGVTSQEAAVIGDGLMDALTGKLANLGSRNRNLWVVPASEIRRRKVSDPQAAFREFGATMIVRGRFSRINHDVRLTLELIDAGRMREIGFADIDRADENLAALQDEAVERLGRLMDVVVPVTSRVDEAGANGSSYNDYITALGYLERYDKPGNLERAVQTLKAAVAASPRFAPGLGTLCRAYTLKFQIDSSPDSLSSARTACEAALKLDERLPGLHASLADLEKIQGHYDLAAKEFQRVIDLDPGDAEALTGLAELQWRLGNLKDAERSYLLAAAVRKQDWQGYNNLGSFYDRSGRHRESIENYKHALDLTPDNAYVLSNLGGAYLDSNDPALFGEAEKTLARSNRLNPSYAVYANLGILYLLEKRYRDSAEQTETALKMNSDDFDVWGNALEVYERLGDIAKAASARQRIRFLTERAIDINERSADAHAVLAAVLAKDRDRESALSHIRTALALEPSNQDVLAPVAIAYEVLGERILAMRYLKQAVRNGYPRVQIAPDPNLEKVAADPRFQTL